MSVIVKTKGAIKKLLHGEPLVDFAIAGFPKCGTTTLHKSLIANTTDLMMPSTEIQFSQIKRIRENFEQELMFGIKNPNFIYELHHLAALNESSTKTKFIIGVRNPMDWLFSFFQYRKLELEQKKSWIVKKYGSDVDDYSLITFEDIVLNQKEFLDVSIEKGKFHIYINALLEIVPKENIFIYILEDLANNPDKVVTDALSFLDTKVRNNLSIKNKNINRDNYEDKVNYRRVLSVLGECYARDIEKTNNLLFDNWGMTNKYW